MHSLQYAQKFIKNSSSFFVNSTQNYVLGLLLSTGNKNCSAMSSNLEIPYHRIYKYYDVFEEQKTAIKESLACLARLHATKENPGVLIVDTTQIKKLYSKKMKFLCYDFNGSMKMVLRGISCVTTAWCNGKILIPLDFNFWVRKKDLKDGRKYRKKTKISQELILEWKDKVPFSYISLDGDYGNEEFLKFLHEHELKYSIRMPGNRKVVIGEGPEIVLKNQPLFQLKRNERYKKTKCFYKGIATNVISQKRKGPRNTKQTVFIVSNLENLSPKEHVEAFNLRWPIEKMFRSLKQHLGLEQCQSTSTKKQRAHIFATFLAFAELEIQKINKKKKSPEEVLKIIRVQNQRKINRSIALQEGFIM